MTSNSLAVNGGGEEIQSFRSSAGFPLLFLNHGGSMWLTLALSINVSGFFLPSNTIGLDVPASLRLENCVTCFDQ